ncbi:DUF2591 family protein [Burkholderia cenocepacia]|uniref:phage protein NinX family protein n=1 Tax=Burkholderia cenocepacia TaxID=95486 RepID=UPI0023B8DBAC|nr:phage protein NinX family protein [Burkholderia cenocepacia]MDF0506549.1 DUF2591 family protein [Burkholderia cenocepacia]
MKVSELTGAMLDYWVARTEGRPPDEVEINEYGQCCIEGPSNFNELPFHPSDYWMQGGPIIEREGITPVHWGPNDWGAFIGPQGTYIDEKRPFDDDGPIQGAPTPLVAAMRAYVASKFGDTVPDQ